MTIGLNYDALPGRRHLPPRCNPGNKPCGKRCIPQDYTCGGKKGDHPATGQTLGRVEEEIRNKPIEYASAIDPRTGQELFRYSGDSTSVDIPPREYARLRGKILTHNHPNAGNWPESDPRSKGFSFSPADINAATTLQIREIRAVSAGYNHSMVMPRGRVDVQRAVSKHSGRIYRQVAFDSFSGKIDSRSASIEYWHRLWTAIAAETPGMTYKRTEVRRKADSLFSLSPKARRILGRRGR